MAKAYAHPTDNRERLYGAIDAFAEDRYVYAIESSDPVIPIPAGYDEPTASADWLQYGKDTTQTDRNSDWQELGSFIGDGRYRNLYLLAHGNPQEMGGDYDNDPPETGAARPLGSYASISASLISTQPWHLSRRSHEWSPPLPLRVPRRLQDCRRFLARRLRYQSQAANRPKLLPG